MTLALVDPADNLDGFRRYLLVERGRRPATTKAYVREVRDWLAWLGPRAPNADTVREWVMDRGGGPSSVTRRLSALRVYYRRFLHEPDPTELLDRPTRKAGIPRPIGNIAEVIRGMDAETALVATFLLETGLRISEACSIGGEGAEDPPAVIPGQSELHIVGKGGKHRIVPLSALAQTTILTLGGKMPVKARTIQRRFQDHSIKAHDLRHTAACTWAADGAGLGEIQDLLGHASPATTRIYTAYSPNRLHKVVDRGRTKSPRTRLGRWLLRRRGMQLYP